MACTILRRYRTRGRGLPPGQLKICRWDGNGVALSWLYSVTLRKRPSSLFRLELSIATCASFSIFLFLSTAACPLVLQRVCSPLIWHNAPFFSLVFFLLAGPSPDYVLGFVTPSTVLIHVFPVGIWAPSASHRPPTFVAWDYRSPKNWSLSFPWLLR